MNIFDVLPFCVGCVCSVAGGVMGAWLLGHWYGTAAGMVVGFIAGYLGVVSLYKFIRGRSGPE